MLAEQSLDVGLAEVHVMGRHADGDGDLAGLQPLGDGRVTQDANGLAGDHARSIGVNDQHLDLGIGMGDVLDAGRRIAGGPVLDRVAEDAHLPPPLAGHGAHARGVLANAACEDHCINSADGHGQDDNRPEQQAHRGQHLHGGHFRCTHEVPDHRHDSAEQRAGELDRIFVQVGGGAFAGQVGAYRSEEGAREALDALKGKGYASFLFEGKDAGGCAAAPRGRRGEGKM